MSIRVTVIGQRELDAKFKKLAVETGAIIIRNDARNRITSRTGKLRRSIKVGRAKKTRDGMAVDIGTDVWYAHLVEFGHDWVVKGATGHVSGRPFLTPALDSRKDEVLSAISFKVKQAIMQVTE